MLKKYLYQILREKSQGKVKPPVILLPCDFLYETFHSSYDHENFLRIFQKVCSSKKNLGGAGHPRPKFRPSEISEFADFWPKISVFWL